MMGNSCHDCMMCPDPESDAAVLGASEPILPEHTPQVYFHCLGARQGKRPGGAGAAVTHSAVWRRGAGSMGVCARVHAHVEARGQPQVSSLRHHPTCLLRQSLSILDLTT